MSSNDAWKTNRKNLQEFRRETSQSINKKIDLNKAQEIVKEYCEIFDLFYEHKLRDYLWFISGNLSNNNIGLVLIISLLRSGSEFVKDNCNKELINFCTSIYHGMNKINEENVEKFFEKKYDINKYDINKFIISNKIIHLLNKVDDFNKNYYNIILHLSKKINVNLRKLNKKYFNDMNKFSFNKFLKLLDKNDEVDEVHREHKNTKDNNIEKENNNKKNRVTNKKDNNNKKNRVTNKKDNNVNKKDNNVNKKDKINNISKDDPNSFCTIL